MPQATPARRVGEWRDMAGRLVQVLVAAFLLLAAPRAASTQERGAAALDQLLRGLPVTTRVLMIGAHPDDEDTYLLAGLAHGHQVETAYLSLTRGDGGQNLIGNELGEALGAIRTEELLAARRLDGGHQFFSRAYDFGFSKNADETFRHWDREALTSDVVRVIRAFRPQVIVAVWSGTRADGHGHHEASGLIARDAFDAAMDTVRFPVATNGRAWTPLKFYRSARSRTRTATLTLEVGAYDPVLGRSPAEIAGQSRSLHRSQGQGTPERAGPVEARVAREVSRVNASTPATDERSMFEGIDTSFAYLATLAERTRSSLAEAGVLMDSVQRIADLRRPAVVVPGLAALVAQLEKARADAPPCPLNPLVRGLMDAGRIVGCSAADAELDAALDVALLRARRALLAAAGIVIDATAPQELLAFGDSMPVQVAVYNRGTARLTISAVELSGARPRPIEPITVLPDSAATFVRSVIGLVDHRPWWLGGRDSAMFADTRSPSDGVARVSYGVTAPLVPSVAIAEDARRLSRVLVTLEIDGVGVTIDAGELNYRVVDPVFGEQRRPAGGVPPITLTLDRGLEYVRAGEPLDRRVRLTLHSHTGRTRQLTLRYLLPKGLRVEGAPDSLSLAAGETREVFVRLRGVLAAGRHEFGIGAASEGTIYTEGITLIEYPHIRPQRLYRSSAMYLQAVPVAVPKNLVVAYVTGVSDAVAPSLRQLDIPTTVVTADELPLLDLSRYTTVVIGPRAYDASPGLATNNARLFEWVRGGGTLVVQYGQYEMAGPGMMPYPVTFGRPAARVTIEEAPIQVLDPRARILTWPNRITMA
ncbi:MAG: PIG-L family deacetylase, partial [Gemmatimonadota bacterium]|nr:PIG-L family deacetylase [Gemmatimonadota bacterium]